MYALFYICLKNRLLHILPGKQSDTNGEHTNDEGVREFDNENDRLIWTEFQQQRKAELKSLASVGHNWNALFMTPDAVATYLSAKYNVSKVCFSLINLMFFASFL